ncbi:MAG: hypothetical protein EXR72_08185 [Myxococcales bacterium]|nr:hypothetical protein [Myxococcales bacterium]
MGYRKFTDRTTFDDATESAEFTAAAIEAHAEADFMVHVHAMNEKLHESDSIAIARRKAQRLLARANALVKSADAFADDNVREFGKDVLAEVRMDRNAPLFRAFFPVRPGVIVDLALEPEMVEFVRIVGVLEEKSTPADLRKEWLPRCRAILVRGEKALEERKRALSGVSSSAAAVADWMVRLDGIRREIDGALTTHAAQKGLVHSFNDRFFPSVTRPRGASAGGGRSPSRTALPA